MNITSKDIRKRDFRKAMRGYDVNEVDAFLDTISSNFEKLVIENKSMQDRIKALESDVEVYRENEQTLQKAIVKSQDLADEIVENAKKKAELINKEAELNIKDYKQNLDEDINQKRSELEELKLRNERLVEEVRNFIEEKLSDFDDFFKSHKIYKMELTSDYKINTLESDEESHNDDPPMESTIKLNTDPSSMKNSINEKLTKPFDDNFEVK
ncbi:MAG TPA: DivIVA domain-containing protein [Ignavibacteria bacterium]|nr:DivIVA domain-containing protein [Ignavibacteria bacterium]